MKLYQTAGLLNSRKPVISSPRVATLTYPESHYTSTVFTKGEAQGTERPKFIILFI